MSAASTGDGDDSTAHHDSMCEVRWSVEDHVNRPTHVDHFVFTAVLECTAHRPDCHVLRVLVARTTCVHVWPPSADAPTACLRVVL